MRLLEVQILNELFGIWLSLNNYCPDKCLNCASLSVVSEKTFEASHDTLKLKKF